MCVSLQAVCIRMAQLLDGARKLGWVLLKSVLRFVFMFINNCVAIPSYCLYLLLLQPLRIWDSPTFWNIEGIMFKWMLAMVSSWGWVAGYTGKIFICPCYVCFPCTLHAYIPHVQLLARRDRILWPLFTVWQSIQGIALKPV